MRGVVFRLLMVVAVLATGRACSGERGEHEQRVNKGMSLISVFPGMTVTSTPLTIRVGGSQIPDDAVVEKVSVVTGSVSKGNRVTGANVVSTYNIKGPGMERFASVRWNGRGGETTFDIGALGAEDIPVKGNWQLSMTGNNVGTVRATTTHTVRTLRIDYRY